MKVLVTGATRNVGLTIIRTLAKEGWEVIGADDRKLPFNSHSRFTKTYSVLPKGDGEIFVDSLIEILKREKPDVLIPSTRTIEFSANRKKLENYTQLLVPDFDSYCVAYYNQKTLYECEKLGIYCPRIFSENEAQLEFEQRQDDQNSFAVVIKPNQNIGGARGLKIVWDKGSFKKALDQCRKDYGEVVIVEYIPGDTESMRTVNLLFDKEGDLAAFFTTKKIRQWPNTGGTSALSESTADWDLIEGVLPFFKKWKWHGPAEVELKIDARDNKPKLIEINPRFWSYIEFPVKCGVNFPVMAYQLSKGVDVEYQANFSYTIGLKYINPVPYFKAVFHEFFSTNSKISTLIKIFTELKGEKVSNRSGFDDIRVTMAKIIFELKLQ